MPSLLVILLAISLTFLVAGLVLSPKPRIRDRQAVSTDQMRRPIVVESVPNPAPAIVQSKHLIVRRSPMEIERYSSASVALPIIIDHDFERIQSNKPMPRTVIIIGFVAIFLLGLCTLNSLFPHHTGWNLVMLYGNPPSASQSSQNTPKFNATQNLVRLSQLDPAQYSSNQEFTTWAYSACSTTAMTEVFNAYGHHYRVTDVLKVEAQIGEITPQLGLLEDIGIQRTAAQFGFKTTWGHNLSLDQIIDIANHGRPVIVSFPPDRYAGGHLLVVTGGNGSVVNLADSSSWNRQSLSRAQFLQWWEGFYAIVTPK